MRPLTRRHFLVHAAGLYAGAGLAGCDRHRPGDDFAALESVVDTLIPTDEDPGAVEAGVPERIRERIGRNPVSAKRYRRLLSWIGKRSRKVHARRFEQLSLQQRDRLLRELHESRGMELAQLRIDLSVALDDCFHEFYSSPAARSVIGYHPPIEGGYPDYDAPPKPTAR